jgi:peroxiredoxin/outer membrane lipoprotein-sorting protein
MRMKRAVSIAIIKLWLAISGLLFAQQTPSVPKNSYDFAIGVQAQPKALDLSQVLLNMQNRLQKAQGISLDVEVRTAQGNRISARVMALRPNFLKVETENQSFYCDGKSAWQYFPLGAVYAPFQKDDKGMHIPLATGLEMYSPRSKFKPEYRAVEETVFEGKHVFALIEEPSDPNLQIRIFIDPESWLPMGFEQKLLDRTNVSVYRNVRTDRSFVPVDFAWTPPKGSIDSRKIKRDGPKLLQVGDLVPDFVLPLTNGKRLTLGEALKGKKALLVNFWFIGCGYCHLEMPEIADLYRTANDLQVVAINDADTMDEVRRFVQKPNYQFPVAIDEGAKIAEAYKVNDKGHPISYLIRPDRTIGYVQVGYDAERKLAKLEDELAKLGIKRQAMRK